ncbi:MAG: TPM domain-containing protein [Clostridia bacterium]|nr:TPM domain-containing protein [Clostridia bacterium]
MTKKLISVLLALLICLSLVCSVSAVSKETRLFDGADLLTSQEEAALKKRMDEISEAYKVEIVIATVNTTEGIPAAEYAVSYYDKGGFGFGEDRDGVQLFLSMEGRDWRIDSFGLGADAVSVDDIEFFGELIVPYLKADAFNDAFNTFLDECEYEINGEINGFPFDFVTNFLISLVIGFVIALIVTGVWRAQLKSVHRQPAASQYTKPGSMHVTRSSDVFLYRTVNRVKRQSSSGSSSGSSVSSRHNSGGGKF